MNDRIVFDGNNLTTSLEAFGMQDVSNSTKESSQNNLDMIDKAIMRLNDNRSALGAMQNRLQSTINNINIYRENLSTANSRIRDTDMAIVSSELTKNNILQNVNVAVLSQANQNAMLALKLI
jgi:flagellin